MSKTQTSAVKKRLKDGIKSPVLVTYVSEDGHNRFEIEHLDETIYLKEHSVAYSLTTDEQESAEDAAMGSWPGETCRINDGLLTLVNDNFGTYTEITVFSSQEEYETKITNFLNLFPAQTLSLACIQAIATDLGISASELVARIEA